MSRVCVRAVGVCAVVAGQCIFARDGHLVSVLQLYAPSGWPLRFWYDMGAHAAVVGRAGLHVSAAAGKVCVDVEEAILGVGRGSDGAAHVLVLVFF